MNNDPENLFKQYVMVRGLNGPYYGILLFFQLDFPTDYPYKPPKMTNLSPYQVVHPRMPIGQLVRNAGLNTYGDEWSPNIELDDAPYKYSDKYICDLLRNPDKDFTREIANWSTLVKLHCMQDMFDNVFLPVLLKFDLPVYIKVFEHQIWDDNKKFY